MKEKLAILGKGAMIHPEDYYKNLGYEIWTLGTAVLDGADRYYELHGIECGRECIRSLSREVYETAGADGIPVNNSISGMMMQAWLEGFRDIIVDGCPMQSTREYIEQRAAVGMMTGYLIGKGIRVRWTHAPVDISYGRIGG
jgi:hypothetical protein